VSSGARWTLGLALLASAAMFGYMTASEMFPKNGWIGWVLAFLCFLGSVACTKGSHAAIAGRVTAFVVFLFCAWYLVVEIANPDQQAGRSNANLPGAIGFMGLIGLPMLYVAIRGRYPHWGAHTGIADSFSGKSPVR
jgi:hypothetical protein